LRRQKRGVAGEEADIVLGEEVLEVKEELELPALLLLEGLDKLLHFLEVVVFEERLDAQEELVAGLVQRGHRKVGKRALVAVEQGLLLGKAKATTDKLHQELGGGEGRGAIQRKQRMVSHQLKKKKKKKEKNNEKK